MKYKVFTHADLCCPFREGNNIPDQFKTEAAAKSFCQKGCCPVCAPLFWWVRVLKKWESKAPWFDFNVATVDPNAIILLPMEGKV